MARRELGEENRRSVQKSKRSYYITLPISYVRDLGWDKRGKEVFVRKSGEGLIISDTEKDSKFKVKVSARWKKKR